MSGVFDGLKVIEVSQGMAGPLAAMVLADNGAEVVKLEPPGGDWARRCPGFLMWNRGKRSAVADLRDGADRRAALRLIDGADVLITALPPGSAREDGLGPADLAGRNPALVHCAISGFGLAASHEDLRPYEWIVSAKSGRLMGNDRLSGMARDSHRGRPIYVAAPINCYGAAMLAVQGITAALIARMETGAGQRVDTSLLDGAAAATMRLRFERRGDAVVPVERVAGHGLVHQGITLTFLTAECADGRYIQMCARQDEHFRNWLAALGLGAVLDEERYREVPLGFRSEADIRELEARIRARMRAKTQAEWMRVFVEDFDVPADPFLTPDEFLRHPQLVLNERVVEIDDPVFGPVRQLGPLVLFTGTPSRIGPAAPRLGEHQSILATAAAPAPAPAPATPAPAVGPAPAPAPAARGGAPKAPLAGVTILEVAYFLAAPWGATLLAELGARVIKVEPLTGDPFRRIGLEVVHQVHGKESIVVDLKTPSGREILHRLVLGSDALLHSFRPGVAERLGMDYETLHAIHPRLVYLYGASYGSKGPHSHRAAFHSTPNALNGGGIIQAGRGNPPVDDSYGDPCSGLAVGVALALGVYAERRYGLGQYLETTMLCSGGYVHSNDMVSYAGRPDRLLPDGEQRGPHALCRLYPCRDGWIFLAVVQDKEWRALATAVGCPEWLADDRYADHAARLRHDADLSGRLAGIFARAPAREWEERLAPGVPVASAADGNMEEFVVREGLVSGDQHPAFGEYWRLPPRVRFSAAPNRAGGPCALGEHTDAILEEFGYGEAERDALKAAGVVRQFDFAAAAAAAGPRPA